MNFHESLIDPTNFGTVADYLRNPKSPIEHVLHVKDRPTLVRLAEHLEQVMQDRTSSGIVTITLDDFFKEGVLLISSRQPVVLAELSWRVAPFEIPRLAPCHVIYLPPFYLAHTPGLFEGTLIRSAASTRQPIQIHHRRGARLKV